MDIVMRMECRACPVRETHCADCMVTALAELPWTPVFEPEAHRHLPEPGPGVAGPGRRAGDASRHAPVSPAEIAGPADLDARERAAVTAFATAGLITPTVAAAARAEIAPGHRRLPDPRSATG